MSGPEIRLEPRELASRARRLEWVLLDVDGVLTDGRLYYGPEGVATKAFDVRDGLGIKLAQRAGLKVGLLTARDDEAVARRAGELGLDAVVSGRRDKGVAFDELLAAEGVEAAAVAFCGDDLTDLPALTRAGLATAPADAATEVRQRADVVLAHRGGRGAVRELVELLLTARGQWDEVVRTVFGPC